MKTFLLTCLIGMIAGAIDILPMIKMKLDRHSIASAFVFYFILPFVILDIDLFGLVWWLKGGVTGLMALPIIIMVAKEDKKSAPPMLIMSAVLGTLIGIAGHFLL
ncbi:MAG: hypothetical protein ACLVLH_18990 [Eisenbergiella massiliensis]